MPDPRIELGLDTSAKISDWGEKKILHIANDKHVISVWGVQRIKQLRDFLVENYPIEGA